MNAIRRLNQTYARSINKRRHDEFVKLFATPSKAEFDPSISGLSADRFGSDDVIELGADRQSGTARLHSRVYTRTAIGPDCTLVEMAREQGEGFVERSEQRVIEAAYVKQQGVWKIRNTTYIPA